MKAEILYQELKELAEKLDVVVSEHNFRTAGIKVKSGFCVVKNQKHCIIDKHIRIHHKIEVLAECLSQMNYNDIFVVPALREFLDRYAKRGKPADDAESVAAGNN